MIYDFHTHTNFSDGDYSHKEVVQMAIGNNVDIMCFTDHDTLLGMSAARELDKANNDIKIYGGIEISTKIHSIKKHAHILAYGFDENNTQLNALIDTTTNNRTESFFKSIDIINRRGEIYIDEDTVKRLTEPNGFFKRHIVEYLMNIGFGDGTFADAMKIFNPETGYAFVDFEYPEATDAIETIRKAGGIPVLAHTFVHGNFPAIEEMLEAGLMGIEAYHPRHSEEQKRMLADFCDKRNLFVTCGSDFHGVVKNQQPTLGCTSVDSEKIREFVSYFDKQY